jgi:hypothetical protein
VRVYTDEMEAADMAWDRFVPEGDAGHSLILARAPLSAPGAAVT